MQGDVECKMVSESVSVCVYVGDVCHRVMCA